MKENNNCFYNPSARYRFALDAKRKLENARTEIVDCLHGKNGKLVFTSSATESNNMIASGLHLRAGQVVLISEGEHPSVYNAFLRLSAKGIVVKKIPLSSNGRVDENKFLELLSSEVALVSIIHVSNETGAINDIEKLCKLAKNVNPKIIFHSDGVQAVGKTKINLEKLGVDAYTISAHKIYAPRGIAGLWLKNGVTIDPILEGGGQESGLRSSTENVSGALALAWCMKKVTADFEVNYEKILKLKNELIGELEASEISNSLKVNSNNDSTPYIVSISFIGIKGEVLMNALDGDGVIVSTGSACSSKKAGNRILEAMGLDAEQVVGSVRISFSPYENYDVKFIATKIINNVARFLKNAKVKV